MKNNLTLTILLSLSLFLLPACITTPSGGSGVDPVLVATSAEAACFLGAITDLSINPGHRHAFEEARKGVAILLAVGNFNSAQLADIIGSLPIEGPLGQVGIIVIGAAISIWDSEGHKLMDLDPTASYATYVRPIAEAILRGLDHGLAWTK